MHMSFKSHCDQDHHSFKIVSCLFRGPAAAGPRKDSVHGAARSGLAKRLHLRILSARMFALH